jgi:hypothetical protein
MNDFKVASGFAGHAPRSCLKANLPHGQTTLLYEVLELAYIYAWRYSIHYQKLVICFRVQKTVGSDHFVVIFLQRGAREVYNKNLGFSQPPERRYGFPRFSSPLLQKA